MPYDVTRTTLHGMTHILPPAEELRLLDAELWQLDRRRAQLLARRTWLVAALQPRPTQPNPATAPRQETSAPGVQNLLLLLGGLLLTIAATVFTLVSWGHMSIAGRALVLGAVTLAALTAPLALVRRGLRATAESVGGLGLALTVLDAYALYAVAFPGTGVAGYTAVASAVLAGLWTAYGLLPRVTDLRLPLPAALVAAQLPMFFWALSSSAGSHGIAAALLVTAAFDTAVALRVAAGSVRVVAVVGAYGLGAPGALTAGWLSWTATGPGAAARAAALVLLAAVIALAAAWRGGLGRSHAIGLAATSGLLTVGALAGTARPALPDTWTVPVHLACGIALLAAVRVGRLPVSVRDGLIRASAAVQGLAVLWALPVVAITLAGPAAWMSQAWSGAPANARTAVTVAAPWPPDMAAAPLVLVAVAAVLALAVRTPEWRPRALTGALTLTWAAALTVPAVLELPYITGLLLLGALTAVALASPYGQPTTTILALITSACLSCGALASQTATLATLTALTAFFSAVSWRLTSVTAPAALAYAAALACATGAAADWQPQYTALLLLSVPVAAALIAPRVKERIPIEATGALAGLFAIGLAATDLPMLAVVLALCAVIAAGTAIRPDRRPAGYAAAVLFVLATWVRLAAWTVDIPEAYTVPVTVPALLVGFLRRRRDPQTSSWTAYAPGLAATLLPSLAAAWSDPNWTRPLLLGLAALSLTLLGAGYNLRAPLLLGGTVLSLDALHELAPYIVQVTEALPRWVLPALAGILLLGLGATYEQRIRDVRRARDLLGKMN
ncbi:SCO7613 C-terminal domain-containing membrane protein [Streptomyces sp. NBC_00459]|uniref:SCO7613 C-terminal domain-containing membrane protein n=1 Tax=Streptomyces sp. NBC_00459 TaxID=2975749 RepID=UPI003FA78D66